MLFAIDIDGTIGYMKTRTFLQVCNTTFGLGIEAKRINALSYQEFFQQPEVMAYQQKIGATYFEWGIGWVALDPLVLATMIPMQGTTNSINLLAEQGTIAYYTARYSTEKPEANEPMEQATRQWLAENHFANATNIVFCRGVKDKLLRIVTLLHAEPQAIVLIDDRYIRLLEEFSQLDQDIQETIRSNVVLVAFGNNCPPEECYGMHVIPLPSWQHTARLLDDLIAHTIQKGGYRDERIAWPQTT